MRWRGRRGSDNIEDRRSQADSGPGMPLPRGGGLRIGGIGGLIAIIAISLIFGVNPLTLLQGIDGTSYDTVDEAAPRQDGGDDGMRQFVGVVLADTENTWAVAFPRELDTNYIEPELVLFTDATGSACGFAQAASGPFYCPADRKIYIDLAFYQELRRRFQAPGDFAQAYVIAHEVGHHVQNLIGILPRVNDLRRRVSEVEGNELSVRVELQADCLAGIWAHDSAEKGLLEEGDIEEAINAAGQIGDDAIQRRSQGYVVPESFNHGSSEQRIRWFKRGFRDGSLRDCDTFAAERL